LVTGPGRAADIVSAMLPSIYAHRLGGAYGPDSSRTALAKTLQREVAGLETDCCLTADREVVLLHDPLLQLDTDLSGWAHERTAAEICGGRLRDGAGQVSVQRPLRLTELLELVPANVALQLEIKAHADPALACETARVVCRQLRRAQTSQRVEIISFHTRVCETASALGFPARAIIIADYRIEDLATWARSAGVGGVCVEHFLLSPGLVDTLGAAGLSVSTGTVNHTEILPLLMPLGLDSITTDRPHELLEALGATSQSAPVLADAIRSV
jgi:glycerophosphoryl diester phosphodiesterase